MRALEMRDLGGGPAGAKPSEGFSPTPPFPTRRWRGSLQLIDQAADRGEGASAFSCPTGRRFAAISWRCSLASVMARDLQPAFRFRSLF